MKGLIIIFIILISIVSIGILTQKHLADTAEELNAKLEELKKEINNTIYRNDKSEESRKKANEISQEIYEKWEKTNKTWSIIVMHSELDQIHLSILEVKSCVEIGDYGAGREEIEKTIFLVEHIKEKEALKLKNIF